ncbi:Small heat shock protein HSP20 protein [Dioscorea alata]|uniref:Small heat shock protein HSP20 protein n=1 Tax=Dioscorea alata TaxID=55571 RepID=A0ACB7TYV4_DIOAL|nr:Small heat shock protein HSP20 protein [Dioscorea alata]
MASRYYSEIDPRSEWVTTEESDIILVYVPGFTKEQLKVQLDTSGKILVSGECVVDGDQWCRFLKEFKLPMKSKVKSIEAKFDEGTLYVILPKQLPTTTTNTSVHIPQQQRQHNESTIGEQSNNIISIRSCLKGLWKHKYMALSAIVVLMLFAGLGIYLKNRSTIPN